MARLQREDFDIGAETRNLVEKETRTGAAVTFLGTVRDISRGEKIEKLDFECYPGMAEKELNTLEVMAKEKFDILNLLIIHRIGELKVDENIVLIVATGIHRPAAFDACRWAIDELKRRVPIWKKEYTVSGTHWVEEHP